MRGLDGASAAKPSRSSGRPRRGQTKLSEESCFATGSAGLRRLRKDDPGVDRNQKQARANSPSGDSEDLCNRVPIVSQLRLISGHDCGVSLGVRQSRGVGRNRVSFEINDLSGRCRILLNCDDDPVDLPDEERFVW